jgi:transcriptional regulator
VSRTEKLLVFLQLVQWDATLSDIVRRFHWEERENREKIEAARKRILQTTRKFGSNLGFEIKSGTPYPEIIEPVLRELEELLNA